MESNADQIKATMERVRERLRSQCSTALPQRQRNPASAEAAKLWKELFAEQEAPFIEHEADRVRAFYRLVRAELAQNSVLERDEWLASLSQDKYQEMIENGLKDANICQKRAEIALRTNLHLGSPEDRLYGRRGLRNLLDPTLAPAYAPTRNQLEAWENGLIDQALTDYLHFAGSHVAFRAVLKSEHGFTDEEIEGVIALVEQLAQRQLTSGTIETKRAILVLRLRDLAVRARERMDLRLEHAVTKTEGAFMGITRTEVEDDMDLFRTTVEKIAKGGETPRMNVLKKSG